MLRFVCNLIFDLSGWSFKNEVPDDLRSFIFLGAPHTSNHDFIPGMAVASKMKRNARFVIKNEWTKFPFGLLMKPAGALGLDREQLKTKGASSNTDVMANLFKEYKELVLMIAPEGTRKANNHWKTGFYYIAQKAQLPIVLGYADFSKKEAGLGPVIYPTNFEEDMKKIMDFYRPMQGKNPQNFALDERFS